MSDVHEEVRFFTEQLVHIESVVNTRGEREIAQTLYTMIASFPYFKDHPEQVIKPQTEHDESERYNVMACVRGTTGRKRTVVLMGHMDTVGTEDYGPHQHLACEPEALQQALADEYGQAEATLDLQSEQWMFGRGALDMKSGLASHLYLLKYYAEHPEQLDGCLVFLAACDEEDNSHGMLSAIGQLKQWQEAYGLEYTAAINAEFSSPRYTGDTNRYIYKGTVGKLLPSFFITGAESHVGACFEGWDPNFMAAMLTKEISYNPKWCDESMGERTVPPVSLKQTDLKPYYTVQTALAAVVYFNFFIHSWSPEDVLQKLKQHSEQLMAQALDLYAERYRAYCDLSGEPYQPVHWTSNVWTYDELHQELTHRFGQSYEQSMERYKARLLQEEDLDLRMYAAKIVEESWKWMKERRPAIILYFSSLYSPKNAISGKNDKEQRLDVALEQAVEEMSVEYPHPIVTRTFFPYISDMSFLGSSEHFTGIRAATVNNPAWGSKHFVDYRQIMDLDIPVINIGPYGHDAHTKLERVEQTYSFDIVPRLTDRVIRSLL